MPPPHSLLRFTRDLGPKLCLLFLSTTLTLIICLILIETYYWNKNSNAWVAPHTKFDPELGWANLQNSQTVYDGIRYTTNSLGFRTGEIDPSKEHILILGDSVAYGSGVNDDENVSHFLNEKLEGLQVLNLAVMGYGIDQYYLTLKKYIARTHPRHIIVIIYTVNDLADIRSNQMFGAAKPLFIIDRGRLTLWRKTVEKFSCSNLIKKSWTLKFFSPDSLRNSLCNSKYLNDDEAAWAVVSALLKKINNLALQYRSRLLFVLSPSLIGVQWDACMLQGFPKKCKELDPGFSKLYQDFNGFMQRSPYSYVDYNNVLLALSEKKDLKMLYNKQGKDIHHYSPLGNAYLASTIFPHINSD